MLRLFKTASSCLVNTLLGACLLVFSFSISGCGSKPIEKTQATDLKLPEKLIKAFETQDFDESINAPELSPAASNTSEANVAPPKKKNSKKVRTMAQKKEPKKKQPKIPKEITSEMIGQGNEFFEIKNRRPTKEGIWVGETLMMDVSWLGTKAGEFKIEVLPFKKMNNRKVYHFKATARTSDLFSLIYKAEDWVETFVDFDGWFSYKFLLHGDESKHIRDMLELFDHGYKKQYVHLYDKIIQKNEVVEKKEILDLTPYSQDALSALYYARTFDMKEGDTIHFPMTTSGKQWEMTLQVLKREEVNTKMGYMNAFKTKVETRFNGVLKQQGDSFIWFSDDERKFPVRFEAKVKIGWIEGSVKKIDLGEKPNP